VPQRRVVDMSSSRTSAPSRAPHASVEPPSSASQRRRLIEAGSFVATWVATGYLLPVSSNAYLLLGIPLTICFQLLVRRRPLRELFAANTPRFALDPRGIAIAVALALAPGYHAVHALAGNDWPTTGWYLAATAGAACAAFALRATSLPSVLRTAALPVAVGAGGMALVYGLFHIVRGALLPAGHAFTTLATYTALYFPATFLMEEVAFRGALDAHVHHEGAAHGWWSAVYVSTLWGIWHLPVSHALPFPLQLTELVVVHIVLGVPLSIAWRRSRNLAGPALAHAVNDAVRNAAMLGL
jgi:membrane protease YdiL (CAAX protease family)